MMGYENQGYEEAHLYTQKEPMPSILLADEISPPSNGSKSFLVDPLSSSSQFVEIPTDDTDPLHSSPPKQTSSPNHNSINSILEPPSYAEAVFRSFDLDSVDSADINGHDHSPLASSSSFSSFLKISVSDPQREQEQSGSLVPGSNYYFSYLITTFTNMPEFNGTEFNVRRRFKDVVALSDRLAQSYRGYFIPLRPDKSVVESQVMQTNEFVEQRRLAVEKYLRRLSAHQVIRGSEELQFFLVSSGKMPLIRTTDVASRTPGGAADTTEVAQPAKGGRDLLWIFKELKQSVSNDWGGSKPPIVEDDKEFLEKKENLQDFEQQLINVSQQDKIHEYLGVILAVNNAFSDRSSAFLTVQTLLSDLSSLNSRIEKLEAASSKIFGGDRSRIRKIEELRETVRMTENAKNCAIKEYEQIKENNRNELERLDKERHDDFVNMLKGFVVNQAGYAEKMAKVWESVAEETSGYAQK
ncbi:hypothetical protein ACS0TY_011131 [Phlomoides rotata]